MSLNFSTLDMIVIAIYFLVLAAIIYFSSRGAKTGEDFNLGRNKFGTLAIMATQGASMKGSGSLIGYMGGAWTKGVGVLFSSQCYNIGGWVAILLGLARKLRKAADSIHITSLGDIYYHRYHSQKNRPFTCLASVWLALSLMASQCAAIGILLEMAFGKYGLTYAQGAVIGTIAVLLCTMAGGLTSVVWTDTFQWFVMTPTIFIIIPIFCVINGASPENIRATLDTAQFFDLRPDISWLGYLISGVLSCTVDITYLTRFITSKDERTAVSGSTYGFLYTTLWAGLVVFFGIAAAIIVTPDMVTSSDQVMYTLLGKILPSGLLGLFAAALLATTISTFDSYLHIGVVAITTDMSALFRKKNLGNSIKFSRLMTLLLAVFCVIWVLTSQGIVAILNLGLSIYASAECAPVLATLFWKKSDEYAVIVGQIGGALGFVVAQVMGLTLPILWGVGISLLLVVGISLIRNKTSDLLPGFDGKDVKVIRGLKQDTWIMLGGIVGCAGALILSVGIGMWVNWACIGIGLVVLFTGVKMISTGVPKEPAPAQSPTQSST
ncbi:sodium:solute symporter family protein [Oscillibacter hominis]|uniref:Sodium:solute symporter family protein n=1 Tax=Oscillibacter hominis TaxID=2763056 RepID=A0A7G9B4W0_9FIRM|nr:sodium:solute symporter family protein [Oscillibacter hominis]QNL44591.1 sodium:solute symporter family protein [Oscillibacter hominis]